MRHFIAFLSTLIFLSCTNNDSIQPDDFNNTSVLARLQNEDAWELEYDAEVYQSFWNFEVYSEYHVFNPGTDPNGLREHYYWRYTKDEVPTDCYYTLKMNELDYEEYTILVNTPKELILRNPIGEANRIIYTYENGVIRYEYREDDSEDNYFPAATLKPSSKDLSTLKICE
ncbi:hypothetical protein [Leeuwenhoekiella sp. H156]|uniref:hypothetical protein n=1 Tax=Leeuwenhoekiella sp. H156 TaxID=3450128 RepID=UPI003FA4111D